MKIIIVSKLQGRRTVIENTGSSRHPAVHSQPQMRSEGQVNILENEQRSLKNADNGFAL